MAVVRGNQGELVAARKLDDGLVDSSLLFDPMVLQLQIEVARAQNLRELAGSSCCLVEPVLHNIPGDDSLQTGGKPDQAVGVPGKEFQIDSGTVIEALLITQRDQADQIPVTDFILTEQNQMVAAVGAPASSVTSFPGYVGLAADDGFDSGSNRRVVELNGSEQIPMIGESQSRHLQFGCSADDVFDAVGSIEKAVMAVKMKMDKGSWPMSHSHSIVLGGLELMS